MTLCCPSLLASLWLWLRCAACIRCVFPSCGHTIKTGKLYDEHLQLVEGGPLAAWWQDASLRLSGWQLMIAPSRTK